MDVTLSQHDSSRYVHNQANQGGEESLLNVNVIFLQSESSVKLLTQIKLNESENSMQKLLTFKPKRRSRQSSCISEEKLPMETDELNKRVPPVRNRRITQLLNNLNNIKEEEEGELVEYKNIPDDNNKSSSSSVSDTFFSLDGSKCGNSENSLYENEENENDTFSSTCSSLPPSINLMEEIESQP
jgi:hypothetical protein